MGIDLLVMVKNRGHITLVRILVLVTFLLTVVLDEQSEAKEAFYYQLARSKSRIIPCNCSSSDNTAPPCPTLLLPGKTRPPGTSLSPQNPSPSPLLWQNYSQSETRSYPAVYPDATIRMGIHPINGPPEPSGQTEDMLYQPFKSETTTASPAGSCNTIPDILLASIHPGTFPSGRDFFYATHTLPELYAGISENTAGILFFQGSHPANSSGAQQTIDLTCPDDISTYTDINTCESYISGNLDPQFDEDAVVRLTWEMTGATEDASPPQGIHRIGSHTFSEGHTTVTYTATGVDGTTATCSFSVTISDNQVPRLENMPPDITVVAAPGTCSATAFWFEPTATDNCTPAHQIIREGTARPGDVFPVGATRVYYTAWDAMGNESTLESFTVTVEDRQPPVLTLPPDLTVQCGDPLPAPWNSVQQLTAAGGSATDNCSPAEITFRLLNETKSRETCPYILTRVYQITDAAGNNATAEHRIVVEGEGEIVEPETEEEVSLKGAMAGIIITAKANGDWNVASTWNPEQVPTWEDDVIIPEPYNVIINTLAECNDIEIQTEGSLEISGTNTLEVSGNWTNNGIFTAGTGTVEFTGTGISTISGSAASEFYNIIINKGSDISSVVETNGTGIIRNTGNLSITNGLFKITTGTFQFGGTSNVTLPASAGVWINGATLSSTYSITSYGLFRITNGIANIGTIPGNYLEINNGGGPPLYAFLDIQGGIINVTGRLFINNRGTIMMTDGIVNICTNGLSNSSNASFEVTATSHINTISGGTIVFQNPNANTTGGDFLISTGAGTRNITGGTFQIGNSATPANSSFRINTFYALHNLTINSFNNPGILISGNDLTLNGQLTMNGGNINAGSQTLTLSNSDHNALGHSSGYIIGNFQRAIATSSADYLFPISDGTTSSEIKLNFAGITTAGNVTLSSTGTLPAGLLLNGTTATSTAFITANTVGFSSVSGSYTTPETWPANQRTALFNGTLWSYFQPPGPAASFSGWTNLTNAAFALADCEPPVISSSASSVCVGSTITLTPSTGGTWSSSDNLLATVTDEGVVTGMAVGTVTFTFTETATGCSNTSSDITVNSLPTISGTLSVCAGSITTLSGSGISASTNPWTSSNTAVATVNASGEVTGVSAGTADITYTDINGCQTNVAVTVNSLPTISGTLSVCAGSIITLSGSGISASTYPWTSSNTAVATVNVSGEVTGVSAGTADITYTDNNGCQTNVTVTVNSLPTASIAGNNSPICSGQDAQFTLTGTDGATVTYNINNGTNSTVSLTGGTAAITVNVATANQTLNLVSVADAHCSQILTESETVIINSIYAGTITENQTICYGGNPALFAVNAAASGPGTITYQWESSTDQANWTSITNATNATYDPPGPLNETTYYRRKTTSTLDGAACFDYTNPLEVTVQQQIADNTISGEQTICEGETPAGLTGNEVTSTQGATIAYQWESSPNGTSSWTQITGATGQNFQPGSLTNDLFFRRIVTSTLNGNSCQNISNTENVFVNNVNPGGIADYQEICLGDAPVTITSTSPATGDGTTTYSWFVSTEGPTGNFTEILPQVSTETYTPPAGTENTTWYRRVATSVLNGVICSDYVIHELFVGKYDPGTIEASDPDLNYCAGDNPGIINGSDQTNVYEAPISFQNYIWQSSTTGPTGGFTTIAGATAQDYNPPVIYQTTWYRRIVRVKLKGNKYCEAPGEPVQMNVYPVPEIEDIPPIEVCKGNEYTITVNASNTGTETPVYKLEYISGTYPAGAEPVVQTNSTGVFTILPLESPYDPAVGQQSFEVSITNGDVGQCEVKKEVIVKIFDIPTITVTTNCATGNDGIITIFASLINANFQGIDIGSIEYTYDNGATWVSSSSKSNLSLGTYYAGARNSASPGCEVIFEVTIGTQAVETTNYSICQNASVPQGEGLTGVGTQVCMSPTNANQIDGSTSLQPYYRSTNNTTYIPGTNGEYYEVISFIYDGGGNIRVWPSAQSGDWHITLYHYPFNNSSPADNFIRMYSDVGQGNQQTIPGNILTSGNYYSIVVSSNSSRDYKFHKTGGSKMRFIESGDIKWYLTETSTTVLGDGYLFNPVGVPGSGLSDTSTPGTYIFYAECGGNDCREPAFFTIHPIPFGQNAEVTICTGETTDIQLVSLNNADEPIDPATITYTWTAQLIQGSATGFGDCVSGCGSSIQQTITSNDMNVCPVIRYTVTPKVGDCEGVPFIVEVLVINDNLISLDPLTPEPATTAEYKCITDVPELTPLIGTHACLGELTSLFEETDNGGSGCVGDPLIIYRTWTFEIVCGDVVYNQEITVIDDVGPTFTVPEDITIYINDLCSYNASVTVTGDVEDEADNCTPPENFNAQYNDVISDGDCDGKLIIKRTWWLEDICGNRTEKVQTITVEDNIPPALDCNIENNLIEADADPGKTYATLTLPDPIYSDNTEECVPEGTVTLTWSLVNSAGNGNKTNQPGKIPVNYQFPVGTNTITYTATDDCGNPSTCSFTVIVAPNDPPVLDCTVLTTPLALNTDPNVCTAEVSPQTPTLVSGTHPIVWTWTITFPAASGIATVTGTYTSSDANPYPPDLGNYNFPMGTSTITWHVKNIAGEYECVQTIIVEDNSPPVFDKPSDFTECVDMLYQAVYTTDLFRYLDHNGAAPDPYPIDDGAVEDFFLFISGNEGLDLNLAAIGYSDNCCLPTDGYTIEWTITFDALTPNGVGGTTISGSGQPSTHPNDFELWGDRVNYTTLKHTITYILFDCHGNESLPVTRDIYITPRPKIIKVTE